MSSIDTRAPFFPRSRTGQTEQAKGGGQVGSTDRNSPDRAMEITDRTGTDARVNIPEGVKDFSRIKKAAMNAPEQDNSEKIARLKAQIAAGTYDVDFDAVADRMLTQEF